MATACGRIGFDALVPGGGGGGDAPTPGGDGTFPAECSAFSTPAPLGGINSTVDDSYPWLSADGLALYFASYRPGGLGGSDLWLATRATTADPFGAPVNLTEINSAANERAPSLSPDGLRLYFSAENRPGGAGSVDIWEASRAATTSPFGTPAPLAAVNTTAADRTPAISGSGLLLCLGSDRPGGSGGYDLWCASRASTTAAFGTPTRLDELASDSTEWAPWLSADERAIVFTSNRPGGAGMGDLWIATRASPADPFDSPQPLSDVNSVDDELAGALSADGQTIVFRSARAGGAGGDDLWTASRTCP